jgi:hypothetical protein
MSVHLPVPRPGSRRPASPKVGRILLAQFSRSCVSSDCDKEGFRTGVNLVHNSPMSIVEQQTPPVEERIGTMVGKIIVLALCALLLWGYSTTFLAQVGLF